MARKIWDRSQSRGLVKAKGRRRSGTGAYFEKPDELLLIGRTARLDGVPTQTGILDLDPVAGAETPVEDLYHHQYDGS